MFIGIRARDDDGMAHHDFTMPVTEAQVRALRVNDTVTLQRHALRHPRRDADPHVRPRPARRASTCRPRGDPHRAQCEEGRAVAPQHPAGYAPVCIGTTTQHRMERFTRPLMAQYGVRMVIGKGGLRRGSLAAFSELGGVYLAIVGGAAALETTWIEEIEDVDLDDLNPESLWKFRIRGFGPLLVAMDSHGGSLYAAVDAEAAAQRARTALAALGVRTPADARRPPRRVNTQRTDILILGSGGAGLFAALHAHQANPALDDHRRGQGPARQVRLHAHGAGRLQRRARGRRLGRAPLHGHDRGRQVAARPGARLDAGDQGGRAHPRAGERARLLLRPQPRRHAAPEGLRRPDLRPHRAQGRPDRHRDHQPAGRAGLGARHPAAGRAPRGRASSPTRTATRSPACC